MKWLLSLVLLVSLSSLAQEDSTKYIWYKFQFGQRMPRGWWDSTAQLPYRDTNYTPARPGAIVMRPSDKQFYKWNGTAWGVLAGSGTTYTGPFNTPATGDTLVNSDKELKRLNPGYGILHTITGTNITQRVDTASSTGVSTKSMLRDTAAAIRASIGSGTSGGDTIVYLSRTAGVVSDADLSEGSTTFGTDNTSAIQSVLNLASHTQSLQIVWDVKVSVTGLRIGPNTYIQALPGKGAILRNNSNKSLFTNRDTVWGSEPIDSNIVIEGGVWNGNNYNAGLNPAQSIGTVANGPTCVFMFIGVRNLIVRDFIILRQRVYAIYGNTIKNGLYENGIINGGSGALINSDGVHFDGNSEHCTARNLKIRAEDDAVAMNADDIYDNPAAPLYGFFPLTGSIGPITDISISDITLDNGLFGVRVLSGSSRVDNIRIRNITGATKGYAVILDNYWQDTSKVIYSGTGNFGSVQIENVNVDITDTSSFSINESVINIGCSAESIILKDIKRYGYSFPGIPTIRVSNSWTVIQSLSLDGYNAYDTSSGIDHILVEKGATINNLQLSRINIQAPTSRSELIGNSLSTILNVQMNDVILDSITSGYNIFSGTTNSIVASNIYHSSLSPTFTTNATVANLILSGYKGTTATSGTFTARSGDAFPASSTQAGFINTTTQSIAGAKTFLSQSVFNAGFNAVLPVTVGPGTINSYNSSGLAIDAIKISNSGLGATFGVQNTNAGGFSGIEYFDQSGSMKVFSGFNNINGQEFRFNNIATGGYISFFTTTEKMRLANNGNVLIGTTSDNGAKLQVSGRSSFSDTGALSARFSYGTNLGSTFTRYSLVTKHYVDSAVAAGGGGGGLSGSGTSGQLALWNGTSSFTGNSNILWGTSNGPRISVGTTNTQGVLNIGGDKNLTSSGAQSYFASATYTDNVTAASGTASSYTINYIAPPTIAATNASVTFPRITTLAIDAPTAGTNATITSRYALETGTNGHTRVGGNFEMDGSITNRVDRAADANTSVTNSSNVVILPSITTNRTLSLPATPKEGIVFTIINTNTTGNTWQFGGGGTLVDEGGASVTSFTNSKTYIIMGDNTANVYRIIKQ